MAHHEEVVGRYLHVPWRADPVLCPGAKVDRSAVEAIAGIVDRAGRRDRAAEQRDACARLRDEHAAGEIRDGLLAALRTAERDRAAAAADRQAAFEDRATLVGLLLGPPPPEDEVTLSRREAQVLDGVGCGMSNHEIATQLFLSANTVKTHLRTAFSKMGVHSRVEALIWLRAHGMPPLAPQAAADPVHLDIGPAIDIGKLRSSCDPNGGPSESAPRTTDVHGTT